MAGFISDLLVGLPVPDEEDIDVPSMLKGLRAALNRINEELEFVQSLRVAREKIDDLEKEIEDAAAAEEEVLRQQKKSNEGIIEHSLRLEEHEERLKGMDARLSAASSARKEG